MKFIADLHIHSHFSRATSKSLDPEHLALWAQKKGISVVGTGDFTHPGWVSELKDKLVEAEDGLFKLRPDLQKTVDSEVPSSCPGPARFLLSGEISCIYKKNGLTRKVHHLILMPDMASVVRFNEKLDRIGNIKSDGRPILGLDSRDLLEITLEASDKAFFIPAHVWTPWFSVFGSKSGFDTLEECFEDLTGHIYALETGLSSDPPMNRLLSALDRYLLVSNSDAHSPGKLGREAHLFDTGLAYSRIPRAITGGTGFMRTVEFYPEEAKYHLSGHRNCYVRLHPQETRDLEGLCPKCGKPLTIGVFHRIHELADRDTPELSKDFFSLIPLPEVLSELLSCGPATKKVSAFYEKLLLDLGPELQILMDLPLNDIEMAGGPMLAEAIARMRRNQVIRDEGYDGEYGVIHLFEDSEKEAIAGQMALFAPETKRAVRLKNKAPRPGKARKKKQKAKNAEPVSSGDPILDPLNPEQKSAVIHEGGHLLIVAGPGTGKTLTLTHRIAHLIGKGIAKPEQVLALTFTRKAATEMAQRIAGLLDSSKTDPVRVSTFHGFCLDILRHEGDRIGLPPEFTL
ncbi:MAG: UvrD-helicase domain-containing protein, partial [Desulfobacterales bacterium]|nr:UvrD-helicase domain-containing protein [Desulfobacterales bacterium]